MGCAKNSPSVSSERRGVPLPRDGYHGASQISALHGMLYCVSLCPLLLQGFPLPWAPSAGCGEARAGLKFPHGPRGYHGTLFEPRERVAPLL